MLRHSVVTVVLIIGNSEPFAEAVGSGWDCKRTNDDSEWVCVTKKAQPKPKSAEPASDQEPSTSITKVEPKLFEPQPKPVPLVIAKQPGWHCKVDAKGTGWECDLVGPDPKDRDIGVVDGEQGDSRTVGGVRARAPVYRNMLANIPSDPWALCTSRLGPPVSPDVKAVRDKAPMEITSDYADIFEESLITFSGNVELTRADQKVWAAESVYDQEATTLNARGDVYYREQGLSLFSDSAFLNLASDQAHLTNSKYIFETIPARGSASATYRQNKSVTRFEDVSYSTCRPGVQDWDLHAENLKIDRQSGVGQALNAWLEVAGIPLLYTPYITFPIDDRRKSGFLAASFGSTEETGFDATIPYYWNIAPNLDMTFYPRVMSKRGVMFGNDIRYMNEFSNSEFSIELVPYDAVTKDVRGQAVLLNRTRLFPNLNLDMDINYVSDDDYLNELGNTLSFSDTRHVRSQANLVYTRQNMTLLTRLEHYNTIDASIPSASRPFRRLPQILLNYNDRLWNSGFGVDAFGEFVNFDRSGTVSGQRLDLKPAIYYDFETPYMFVLPRFSLQHTQYWLDDPKNRSVGDIGRTLPIVSLDGGLFFDRFFGFGDGNFLQTLEPRLFYLYIPFDKQNDIPLFDTSLNDFNFNQLFWENRFSGSDRINDANQVTLALTSRIIDNDTGRERLRASLGQIYFFRDRQVTLNNTAPITNSSSNVIAELSTQLTDGLSLRSSVQWNPDNNDIDRGQATLQYRDGFARIFNLSYRYRKDIMTLDKIIDQADASFRWPIVSDLYFVGRWQYSFLDSLTLESFLGIEKESCCWRFRFIARRFVNDVNLNDSSSEINTGFFIQLELKGFTSFGDRVERFLERNISGYRIPER